MKVIVDGVEVELNPTENVELVRWGDRWLVRTSIGTRSAVSLRVGDKVLVSYGGRVYEVERGIRLNALADPLKDGRQRKALRLVRGQMSEQLPGVYSCDNLAPAAKMLRQPRHLSRPAICIGDQKDQPRGTSVRHEQRNWANIFRIDRLLG